MQHLQFLSTLSLLHPTHCVECQVKRSADDFIVREVHETPAGLVAEDCSDFHTKRLILNSSDSGDDTAVSRPVPAPSTALDDEVIATFIAPHTAALASLNSWVSDLAITSSLKADVSYAASQQFHFHLPPEPSKRRVVFEYAKSTYCNLQFSSGKLVEDGGQIATASIDLSYFVLLDTLSIEDVCSLYAFKNSGPGNANAPSGVLIGLNLSKSARTAVYREVTRASRALDSRTVDVKGKDKGKAMLVYWKELKRGQKRDSAGNERSRSSEEMTSECAAVIDDDDAGGVVSDVPTVLVDEYEMTLRRGETVSIWFALFKRDVEQLDATRRLVQSLTSLGVGVVGLGSVQVAGIKDKRAATYQRASLTVQKNGLSPAKYQERINSIASSLLQLSQWDWRTSNQRGIAVGNIQFATAPIQLGSLWGNDFEISLHQVTCPSTSDHTISAETDAIAVLVSSLLFIQQRGFPNYFGSQRMGIIHEHIGLDTHTRSPSSSSSSMPIGPTIGRLLLRGQFAEAIDAIVLGDMYLDQGLADTALDESQVNNARRMYRAGGALSLVLSLLPTSSTRERVLVKGLLRFGRYDDPLKVIRLLPYSALTLYISAYQSFIWNAICSYRLRAFGEVPLPGDIVLPEHEIPTRNNVKVLTASDVTDLSDEEDQRRLFQRVALPLFGDKVIYPQNAIGRYYDEFLQQEGIPTVSTTLPSDVNGDTASVVVDDTGDSQGVLLVDEVNIEDSSIEQQQQQQTMTMVSSQDNAFFPKGTYRSIVQRVYGASITPLPSEEHDKSLLLRLRLPQGSYATALLRELTHNHKLL